MKAILLGGVLLSVSEILMRISKFAAFVCMAKIYGPQELGSYSYIFNYLLFFYVLGDFGITVYISKTPKEYFAEQPTALTALLNARLFISALFILVAVSFGIICLGMSPWLCLAVACLILSDTIFSNLLALYRHRGIFRLEIVAKCIVSLVYLCIALVVLYLEADMEIFVITIACFVSPLSFFMLYRVDGYRYSLLVGLGYISSILVNYKKELSLILLNSMAMNFYLKVDVVVLGLLSNASEVGSYALGAKFLEGVMSIANMFSVLILNKLTNTKKQGFSGVLLLFIALGAALSSLFYIGSQLLVTYLLSDEYPALAAICNALSIVVFCSTILTCLFTYMLAFGRNLEILLITIIMAIFNIGLNIYAAPIYGGIGSAYVLLASELFGISVGFVLLKRLRFDSNQR